MATLKISSAQQLYIAYYGRPADPFGEAFWDSKVGENTDYGAIADAFGNSPEALALFGGLSDAQAINLLYQQIFGRNADNAGLAFYTGLLASGEATLANIAIRIVEGIQEGSPDAAIFANKVEAANAFTDLVVELELIPAYTGPDSIEAARAFLFGVTTTPASPEAIAAAVEAATISEGEFILTPGQDIVSGTAVETFTFFGNETTLGNGDILSRGAATNAILDITTDGSFSIGGFELNGIQTVELFANNGTPGQNGTLNLARAFGLETIFVDQSNLGSITFSDVQTGNGLFLDILDSATDFNVNIDASALLGDDTIDVRIAESPIDADSGEAVAFNFTQGPGGAGAAIETLNLESATFGGVDNNVIEFLRVSGSLETLNITGDADLEIVEDLGAPSRNGNITTINASTLDADLSLDYTSDVPGVVEDERSPVSILGAIGDNTLGLFSSDRPTSIAATSFDVILQDGNDSVVTDDGDDSIVGAGGDDTITAGAFELPNPANTLTLDADTVDGGEGNNSITTGAGEDSVVVGDGNNFISTAGQANDTLKLPDDTVITGPTPVIIDGDTVISGTETITITPGDTVLDGDSDIVVTGDGNNTIVTGQNSDSVIAGAGNDSINTASDAIFAGFIDLDEDVVDAGEGNNRVITGIGDDSVIAGAGNDDIDVGTGDNIVNAGDGNNIVNAFDGDDSVIAGSGSDRIIVRDGDNIVNAGDGNNEVISGSGEDSILTGSGNDFITAGEGDNTVVAGGGDDVVVTEGGDDSVFGGEGDDILLVDLDLGIGTSLAEAFIGSFVDGISADGEDTVVDLSGDNIISTGGDNDSIRTGTGNDIIAAGVVGDLLQDGTVDFDDEDIIVDLGGNNLVIALADEDSVITGDGSDLVLAGFGEDDDVVRSGGGDDFIEIASGEDFVQAGAGNDFIASLLGATGEDLSLESGDWNGISNGDTILGGSGFDVFLTVFGDGDNDIIINPKRVTSFAGGVNGTPNQVGPAGSVPLSYLEDTDNVVTPVFDSVETFIFFSDAADIYLTDNVARQAGGTVSVFLNGLQTDVNIVLDASGFAGNSSLRAFAFDIGATDVQAGILGESGLRGGAGNDTLGAGSALQAGILAGGTDVASLLSSLSQILENQALSNATGIQIADALNSFLAAAGGAAAAAIQEFLNPNFPDPGPDQVAQIQALLDQAFSLLEGDFVEDFISYQGNRGADIILLEPTVFDNEGNQVVPENTPEFVRYVTTNDGAGAGSAVGFDQVFNFNNTNSSLSDGVNTLTGTPNPGPGGGTGFVAATDLTTVVGDKIVLGGTDVQLAGLVDKNGNQFVDIYVVDGNVDFDLAEALFVNEQELLFQGDQLTNFTQVLQRINNFVNFAVAEGEGGLIVVNDGTQSLFAAYTEIDGSIGVAQNELNILGRVQGIEGLNAFSLEASDFIIDNSMLMA
ncbi:DUF4214 domain-containing protein [Synechococcus elongatus IITB7]|uniref:beta strand repeat-containing protein n=1 Tax=Synechococcus elongatus TaxID=32046 RepID=UPI0030D272ED